jgi:hypothetical protein
MKKVVLTALPILIAFATPAFADVTVSSPGDGATVASPFNLSAYAGSCSGQAVAAMGYSLDGSTDTTIVNDTSINASVPAATGGHTLHVKAWGNQGSSCVSDVGINVTAGATSNGIDVSSPGNGAQVGSSFQVSASAGSCQGQQVAAMGYSLDDNSDISIVNGTAVNGTANAGAGWHTLHVKAWGNQGSDCVADLSIDVNGATAAAATTSSSGGNGITVDSPGNGATVGTQFTLTAGASDCQGQPVGAMGYSFDDSSNTTIVNNNAIGATVSTSTGSHVLHVKAWGNQGAGCVDDLQLNVSSSSGSSAPSGGATVDGITVAAPSNGLTVNSPFDLSASAGSCQGQPVGAMGYSLDNDSNTAIFNSTNITASIPASSGGHTLHVKSWGNQGSGCVQDVSINVNGGGAPTNSGAAPTNSGGSGPYIPSWATTVGGIQTLGSWQWQGDPGTSGGASGSSWVAGSPSLSGGAREFVTNYWNGGGELYWTSFADDTNAQNFEYDAEVYIAGSSSQVANIEMDMNQVIGNGQTVLYGFQCDGYNGVWDYTTNAGTPNNPVDHWIHSNQPCNPQNWAPNTWHHVQVTYSRDTWGNVTYQSVWLDGVEEDINATVPSAFALGWAPVLLTNFQVDGMGSSGQPTVYVDQLSVSRW